MADKVTKVVLDLDNRDFVLKMQEALGLVKSIGEIESFKEIAGHLKSVGMIAGVAAGSVLAVKAALDLTKEAENIRLINTSFDSLAESANVSATAIREGLADAVKGLADDTDVIQAASRGIILLGENASRLPEIMDLARRSTKLFGGDLVQTFESMSQAIASGNTRALRQYGLIIDTDAALKKHAATLGVHVSHLSDAGRKQAIMNAALEQGREKFKNVDESVTTATDASKRFIISLKEMGEAAILAFDRVFGPTVRKAANNFSDTMSLLAQKTKSYFLEGEEGARAQTKVLETNIKRYEYLLSVTNKAYSPGQYEQYERMLKSSRAELERINSELGKRIEKETKAGEVAGKPAARRADGIDYEKQKEDRLKFERQLAAIKMERIEADLQTAQTVEEAEKAYAERTVQMVAENNLRRAQLDEDFRVKKLMSETQYQEALDNLNRIEIDKLKNYDQELQDARIRALENYQNRVVSSGESFKSVWGDATRGMSAAFAAEGAKAQRELNNFGRFGQITFNSLKKNSIAAFKAIGDGSQNAGQAMKGFMFNAIADIAEAQGEMLLASGIGTFNPIQVAQGGALIALAQVLRSQGGGAAEGGGVGGGTGGGGGGIAGGEFGPIGGEKPEPIQKEQRTVTLNIAGNYFDTDQSRTRIMEMIRESGDFTDFNINRIGP